MTDDVRPNMKQDIKPDIKQNINGPPHDVGHRELNARGGRRFSRFGPRVRTRGALMNFPNHESDQNVNDDNDSSFVRARRNPARGGRGGNFGSKDGREEVLRNRFEERINEKLAAISGSTLDLPHKDVAEKKFSSRCRLYVGNLGEVKEEDITEMFREYGEMNECFVNTEKQFAFIRLDYRANAERAKRELDGSMRNNRPIKVRFAPVGAAIKVKNLTQWVTNELLEYAFSVFGDIENAKVLVDERGNSLREGIVEFARKPMALFALKRCAEGCFFLTNSLKPVVAEPFDVIDDIDGYPEKSITRKPMDYVKSREIGPRFATPSSFEFEYGSRWKTLYEMFKQKEESLKRDLKMEEEKLEAQMEYARYEHETEMLREQLRQREMDRDRQKQEWEMKERLAEEQKLFEEENMRRQADEMNARMMHQEEDLRRRKRENKAFMQSQGMDFNGGDGQFGNGNMSMDANEQFEGGDQPVFQPPNLRGHWGQSRPSRAGPGRFKRRRY